MSKDDGNKAQEVFKIWEERDRKELDSCVKTKGGGIDKSGQ